ncbi:sirohydrochlorin chelatase [Acidimangrovimonas sediminis]|uniref:sirohydrochlorin chelatase n=1 Tax=Acidimangrovimonas sediminis TaxID=2056283 RepID=UPI000C80F9CA|nr:CbiX/SirB N-terminal domain-containing protein [Acidimangrovimonas sediminis]
MSAPALLVAHGSPSDPAPQEAAMAALAARVAALSPGRVVRAATLAAPGALEQALEGLEAPLVYPFFMAEGWFTRTELPRRLAAAGAEGATCLAPFGADPGLPDLVLHAAEEGAGAAGLDPAGTIVLLAAHGSGRTGPGARASAEGARAMARRLAAGPFEGIEVGLIEEPPFVGEAARRAGAEGRALCLPLFALAAGHVTGDLPAALAEAGFPGPLLAPIGAHWAVPGLIAAALKRAG